jgi:hypothetical protein
VIGIDPENDHEREASRRSAIITSTSSRYQNAWKK